MDTDFFVRTACYVLFFTFLSSISINAQDGTADPIKFWDKTYGGSERETDVHSIKTSDGGFLICSSSQSGISGTKTSAHLGSWDWWVFKVDAAGQVQWDFSLGAASEDGFRGAAIQAKDGNYILTGHIHTGVTDKVNSEPLGGRDILVIKINAQDQSIMWQARIGGDQDDVSYDLIENSNGDIFVSGYTLSTNISGYSNKGSLDLLLSKIDSDGQVSWVKTFGGAGFESADKMISLSDNSIVVGGYSNSTDLNTPNNGNFDYWLLKLDSDGVLIWDHLYGGSQLDAVRSLGADEEGNIYVGGESYSDIEGQKSDTARGGQDIWLLKVDSSGEIVWDKTIGSTGNEQAQDLMITEENKVIIGGYSNSTIGGEKMVENYGSYDLWYLQLNDLGEIEWQDVIGGNGVDAGFTIAGYDSDLKQLHIAGQFDQGGSGNIQGPNYGASDILIATVQLHRYRSKYLTVEQDKSVPFTVLNGVAGAEYFIFNELGEVLGQGIFNDQELSIWLEEFAEIGEQELQLKIQLPGRDSPEHLTNFQLTVLPPAPDPEIFVNPVMGDDVINKAERRRGAFISGSTNGIEDGQVIYLEFGRKRLNGTVQNGEWRIDIPWYYMQWWGNRAYSYELNVEDTDGNKAEAYVGSFQVDFSSPWVKYIERDDKKTVKSSDRIVQYSVHFSEQVQGFESQDLEVIGDKNGGATIVGFETLNNKSFHIQISEFRGKGKVYLSMKNDHGVTDLAENPLYIGRYLNSYFKKKPYEIKIKKDKRGTMAPDLVLVNEGSLELDGVLNSDNSLNVYPNPTSDRVSIDLKTYKDELFQLQLIDLNGRAVRTLNVNGGEIVYLDISAQKAGMYMLRLKSDLNSLNKRLQIKR